MSEPIWNGTRNYYLIWLNRGPSRILMLLANSEVVGIWPHMTLHKSPEIRMPPPSKNWSVTLKID